MIVKQAKKIFNSLGYSLQKNTNAILDQYYHEIYQPEDLKNRRFYNVGAGGFKHPYWTNVDFFSEWYKKNSIDIHFDLLTHDPFPIESDSACAVFSTQTIEHITTDGAQNFFNEAFRILKKGAPLRLITPDCDILYRSVIYNNHFFWRKHIHNWSKPEQMERLGFNLSPKDVSYTQLYLYETASHVSQLLKTPEGISKVDDNQFKKIMASGFEKGMDELINLCSIDFQKTQPGNHFNWWNYNKLHTMLEKAGFKIIYKSGYKQSMNPIFNDSRLDNYADFSLFVEAIKE
jgi:hypothetical protein